MVDVKASELFIALSIKWKRDWLPETFSLKAVVLFVVVIVEAMGGGVKYYNRDESREVLTTSRSSITASNPLRSVMSAMAIPVSL